MKLKILIECYTALIEDYKKQIIFNADNSAMCSYYESLISTHERFVRDLKWLDE